MKPRSYVRSSATRCRIPFCKRRISRRSSMAKRIWVSKWITSYGDVPEAWIEIPGGEDAVREQSTGRAVLCWSTFYPDFNACSASSRSTRPSMTRGSHWVVLAGDGAGDDLQVSGMYACTRECFKPARVSWKVVGLIRYPLDSPARKRRHACGRRAVADRTGATRRGALRPAEACGRCSSSWRRPRDRYPSLCRSALRNPHVSRDLPVAFPVGLLVGN